MRPRDVGDDSEQPGFQRRAPLEPVEAAKCAEPCLLDDLVGDGARADERERDFSHRRPVPVDERDERLLVAAAERRKKRNLVGVRPRAGHPFRK